MMKNKLITFTATILLSIFVSILMIQNNRQIKAALVNRITTALEQEWNAKIDTDSCSLDLFSCSISLQNGSIKPHAYQDTTWGFKKVIAKVDPLALLLQGETHITLTLFDFIAGSTLNKDGSCNLASHLTKIFTPSENKKSPLTVDSLTIHNCALDIESIGSQITVLAEATLTVGADANNSSWIAHLDSKNSKITLNNQDILTNIKGASSFIRKNTETSFSVASNHSCTYSPLPHHDFIITGTWNNTNKIYTIANTQEKTDLLVSFDQPKSKAHIAGTIPLEACTNLYKHITGTERASLKNTQGLIKLDIALEQMPNSFICSGNAELYKINNLPYPIHTLSINNLQLTNNTSSAEFTATLPLNTIIAGTSSWNNNTKQGEINFTNTTDIELLTSRKPSNKGWIVLANEGQSTITFNDKGEGLGSFNIKLTQEPTSECTTHKGSLVFNTQSFKLSGKSATDAYEASFLLQPKIHCSTITYTTSNEPNPVIKLNHNVDNPYLLEGSIKYSFLQSLISQHVRRTLLGKNNFITFTINQENPEKLSGSIKSKGNNFCIPEFNNLIKNFSGKFCLNIPAQELHCSDITVDFSKGSITCPQLNYCFAAEKSFLHAPIEINNLLINWKKDLHSFIYGTLLASKQNDSGITEVTGNIILKKTIVKGDFLSTNETSQYSSFNLKKSETFPIKAAIRVTTEKPALIKTAALETHASVNIMAHYDSNSTSNQQLKLTGAIDLEDGHLKFLQNKLFIDYGKIQFMTSSPADAMIDLIAKNRINKYTISMQASGSLRKNSLVLESTPELTEEQILSLLLAGSENSSLQSDLPIILMQNLNTYLLSSSSTNNSASAVMHALSKPLKYFQIAPIFTDQAGHSEGGIKGTFSYAFNDQIRAQLQKNLTFTQQDSLGLDDVWFNVEYLVSDDINVKFVREQHGDMGSEVEVKFKF